MGGVGEFLGDAAAVGEGAFVGDGFFGFGVHGPGSSELGRSVYPPSAVGFPQADGAVWQHPFAVIEIGDGGFDQIRAVARGVS